MDFLRQKLLKIYRKILPIVMSYLYLIKNNVIILTRGEGNYNSVLYLWGLCPIFLIMYFYQRKIDAIKHYTFFRFLFDLIVSIYFLWHLFVVRKTLKQQPQYKKKKVTKEELFKGKSEEEIKQIRKNIGKERIKKALLLTPWDTAPAYEFIVCLDAYVALTQIVYITRFFESI